MAGENDVTISGVFQYDAIVEGVSKVIDRAKELKEHLDKLSESESEGLIKGFEHAALAISGIGLGVTGVVGFLTDCVYEAIKFEGTLKDIDDHNSFSYLAKDAKEAAKAIGDTRIAIGQAFLPTVKEAVKEWTFGLDTLKEKLDSNWPSIKERLIEFNILSTGGTTDKDDIFRSDSKTKRINAERDAAFEKQKQQDLDDANKRIAKERAAEDKEQKANQRAAERIAEMTDRELEKQAKDKEREEIRKEREEQKAFEEAIKNNEKFRSNTTRGRRSIGEVESKNEFRSSIEDDANSVFRRIQAASASNIETPEAKAIKKFNEEAIAQQTETNKFLSESVQTQKQTQKLLEDVGTLA